MLKPQRVDVRYPGEQALIPGQVQGYSRGESGELATAGLISMTQPHAAGALVGNVESLWRWNQALHGGKLLQPATYQRMVTPEGAAKEARYGFGISTASLRGQSMLQHGGGIHGFATLLVYQPETQLTVALLSNSDSAGLSLDLIARKLAAHAMGKPYPALKPVRLDAATLQAYEGVYSANGGKDSRTLRVVDGVLTSTRTGSRPIKLTPLGGDRFAFEGTVAQAQVERTAQGATLAYYPDAEGQADRWAKVAELPKQLDVALSPAEREALVGDYAGPQIRMRIFLDEQGRLRGQVPGQPVVSLKAQSARELQVVEVDARLSFSAEADKALSVTLKQGGATLALTRQ